LTDADALAARLGLAPDPFDGFSRVTEHAEGRFRSFLLLLPGTVFSPWAFVPADTLWVHEDGAACALSRSADGIAADAVHLGPDPGQARSAFVREGTAQTIEPLGAWTLLRGTFMPDATLAQRAPLPEDWFPGRGF
jgi:predicted cupin superfamily sugar epimerase